MERSTIFNGKIHYFDWAIFNSYVKLPEGNMGESGFELVIELYSMYFYVMIGYWVSDTMGLCFFYPSWLIMWKLGF